ncbi:MAG: putative secondary metabolism biosynthetic enzyme [Bathelium mastoideum]|nr:MAG: putative secondary metabolism biosynthetic enzyme [Bathelium mastoideum]
MTFTLGDLLLLADRSILNPWLTGPFLAGLKLLDTCIEQSLLRSDASNLLPSAGVRRTLTWLFGIGLTLRSNRALSRKALNNGVPAKFDWDKEIVLITGGAGGIGAATARKLTSRCASVIVLDVLPLTYEAPKNLHYFQCDLTDYTALQSVAELIKRDVGEPTCVVANAGICRGKTILDATLRDIELTFGVNNLGLIWTAKTFLPSMAKNNHGHFVVIASQTGHSATAGIVDYSATKAAAIAIYEGIQSEMKHSYKAPAVRVSCVSPSAVNTQMFSGIKAPSNFVIPRLQPEDVANLVADVLRSTEAQNVMIPAFAYISPPTRALPDWWRVGLADGGAPAMTELRPHHPID